MKDKKPIAVGDRVRVYHRNVITGKVDTISPDGHIGVIEDGFYSQHDESPFHPKQCRRLRKKPRHPKQEERVEIWITQHAKRLVSQAALTSVTHVAVTKFPVSDGSKVFLTELRPGETIVSREKLAKAWDKNGSNKCIYPLHDHSEFFDMLCIALGLPAKEEK